MKDINKAQSHFRNPKFPQVWGSLILAGAMIVVSIRFFPKAPDWISEMGILMVVAGLITIVIGSIAAHREWLAKQKAGTR